MAFTDPLIFLFGSNEAGIHGAGAADFAVKWKGAKWHQGWGLSGNSFALPTKDQHIKTLPFDKVADYVNSFKAFATEHPELKFQVTRIGCGLAGFSDDQIRPLFDDAPSNCFLPGVWNIVNHPTRHRIVVAGGREFNDQVLLTNSLNEWFKRYPESDSFVFADGGARGADHMGGEWAKQRKQPNIRVFDFPAEWDRYGKKLAGPFRNQEMAWFGDELIAFWDGESSGTGTMIKMAKEGGLKVNVIAYGLYAKTGKITNQRFFNLLSEKQPELLEPNGNLFD